MPIPVLPYIYVPFTFDLFNFLSHISINLVAKIIFSASLEIEEKLEYNNFFEIYFVLIIFSYFFDSLFFLCEEVSTNSKKILLSLNINLGLYSISFDFFY